MAETKVGILLEVQDRATQSLKSVGSSLESMENRVKSMQPTFTKMAAVGTAAFGGLTALAYKSVTAYAEAERSQRQLEHAILDVSHGTKEQVKAVEELTGALQDKAGIDADSLKAGVAQLSTFGLSSAMVVKLTKSLADLTVNQNGVNASADQYIQSANIMAKALNGQFGVLEKSGIRFTEAQQKMIQFGNETERAAALQEGFNQNLRETTDTVANGLDGAMARVNRQFEDIIENIGGALAPALAELLTKVQPIITRVVEWTSANPELTAKIILVAGAVAGLVAVLGAIGLVLPAIIAGFGLLFSPITAIIVVIGLLVAAGIYLYQHWDEVRARAMEIWTNIATFFQNIGNAIVASFQAIWGGIVTFFQNTWDVIVKIFSFAIALIVGLVVSVFDAMGIDIIQVFKDIGQFLTDFWNETVIVFQTTVQILSDIWVAFWTMLKDFLTPVFEAIKLVATAFWGWLKNTFTVAAEPIKKAWDFLWQGLTTSVSGAWEAVKQTVRSSINWIIEKINAVIQAINKVAAKGAGIVGVQAPQLGQIPLLANGGIVTRPTLAMVGEQGAEAVIPLSRLAGAGVGGNITINIMGGNYLSEGAGLELGNQIIEILRRNMRF